MSEWSKVIILLQLALEYCVKCWETYLNRCKQVIEKAEETTNDQQIRKHNLKRNIKVNCISFFPEK